MEKLRANTNTHTYNTNIKNQTSVRKTKFFREGNLKENCKKRKWNVERETTKTNTAF